MVSRRNADRPSKSRLAAALLLTAAAALAGCGRGNASAGRALDPANELPFGRLDAPKDGEAVPAQIVVGGWAMDDRGIKEVRVYVDNHFVNALANNTPRPDVSKVYPTYAHNTDTHGWTMTVIFEAPGSHTLIAQAVDTDGATRDIGSVTVVSH